MRAAEADEEVFAALVVRHAPAPVRAATGPRGGRASLDITTRSGEGGRRRTPREPG
ncbi:hypothetical protein [Streptomyces sp. LN325]|uniref:hypothetical protein n=1 Tax=Streptomyces sp. LN325 TaxID=3112976 RepID=UPI003722B81D